VYAKYVFFLAGDFWRGYTATATTAQIRRSQLRKPSQNPLHRCRSGSVT
jgi:hypothetical protein